MANYRNKVRVATVAALADETTGFNVQLAAIADHYGIEAFEIDFEEGSTNFMQANIEGPEIPIAKAFEFPGIQLYCPESVKENRAKFSIFSGFVAMKCSVYIRLRALEDEDNGANQPDFSNDLEKWPEAVEDALHEALTRAAPIFTAAAINWSGWRSESGPVQSLGDGHVQQVDFYLGFEVHL